MTETVLLDCPCCSGTAYQGTGGMGWGRSFVACRICGLLMEGGSPCSHFNDDKPAIEKWNTRVEIVK